MVDIRKFYVFAISILVLLLINGCGGSSNNNTASGKPASIRVSFTSNNRSGITLNKLIKNNQVASSTVYADDIPVLRTDDWWVSKKFTDSFNYGRIDEDGRYFAPGGCVAIIEDGNGQSINLTAQQKQQITWTCLEPEKIENINYSDGSCISFNVMSSGVIHFTVTYLTLVAHVQIITNDFNLLDIDEGLLTISSTKTKSLTTADLWVDKDPITGLNRLNAPGGIAFIVEKIISDPNVGEDGWILGDVKAVPQSLAYNNTAPLVHYGTYIMKPRNGNGFVKIQVYPYPDSIGPSTIISSYSPTNQFADHF